MSDTGADAHIADILAVGDLLLYTFATAFVIGFIYLIVLRLVGGIIIWCTIIAIIGGSAYGGYMLYNMSEELT